MSKQIIFNDDVYKKLIKGVEILANAVTATLGPKGRYVVLDQQFGYPIVTNDGYPAGFLFPPADFFFSERLTK